jgi:hypothetical protein
MDISRETSELIKIFLLLYALGLVVAWRWFGEKLRRGLLIALVVASTANYARFGPKVPIERVDTYDLIHYYLNTKYFDELGYYDLYPAAILVDLENGGPRYGSPSRYMAQNEAGHGYMPIDHAVSEGKRVRATRFTAERWEAFEHDFLVLHRDMPGLNKTLWAELILDHGFNGTPPWTTLAEPLVRIVPVEAVKLLGYVDLLLILGGVLALGWAYGSPTAMWAWAFFMLSYSARWPTLTWALLRYDYVAALMMAMAAIKKGRPWLGGMLAGWSASMRLFPALWMAFPGIKGLIGLGRKEVSKPLLRLAGGFLLSVALLQGLAIARHGVDTVQVHLENMNDHNDAMKLSSRRAGLALGIAYEGQTLPKNIDNAHRQRVDDGKPLRFALAGLAIVGMGWALRKRRDDEAFAFGFVPFFLLTTASYYYYITRITLVAMHAAEPEKARNRVGLCLLLGIELFCNAAETWMPGHRIFLVGWLSWGLSAYTAAMIGMLIWEQRREDAAALSATPPASPQPAP